MIRGIGLEVIEILLAQNALAQRDEHFLQQFTDGEQVYCCARRKAAQHLSVRLAAKYAVLNVLGIREQVSVPLTDIEICTLSSGAPFLVLKGVALGYEQCLAISVWHVSLSHTDRSAAAFVIAEGG